MEYENIQATEYTYVLYYTFIHTDLAVYYHRKCVRVMRQLDGKI